MNPLWKSWLKKKDLTDKEWEKQKKLNEKKRKEQMGKDEKKHSQEQRDQDKTDRERGFPTDDEYDANTCPTCGHNTMDDDPPEFDSQQDHDDYYDDRDD